jgi:hypothetical protein
MQQHLLPAFNLAFPGALQWKVTRAHEKSSGVVPRVNFMAARSVHGTQVLHVT